MRIIPTVAVLVIHDERVLLVRHTENAGHLTGTYGLPSGRINNGESEKEAAIRELSEEADLKTTEENLVEFEGNYYIAEIDRKDGQRLKFGWRVFLCREHSGEITNSDESIPEWVEIEKLNSYNLLPNVKNAVYAGLKLLEKS